MYFVDSHIHFSDSAYNEYLKLMADTMINLNIQSYSVSVDLNSSAKNIEIKNEYFKDHDLFKPFVGIHPQYASLQALESFNDFYELKKNDIMGIGEIGLDPTYTLNSTSNDLATQRIVFNDMLKIAEENHMPVSVHSRRSLDDVLEIITSYRLKSVVFHWFDGSKKFLRRINEHGYYVSFGPYSLYSGDKRILLNECDLSLLLLETDGPVSYRRCFENVITSPIFIISLINFVSFILKRDFDDVCNIVYKNSCNYIGSIWLLCQFVSICLALYLLKKIKYPRLFFIGMDRVKRMSNELLERYPDKFTIDFNKNKEAIQNYAQIRSKELRNKIAGYITAIVNRNISQQNASMAYSEDVVESQDESWVNLITINLLGGIKKLIGYSNLKLDGDFSNIGSIISYLENNYCSNNKIDETNILVAINGVECSLLGGNSAQVLSGDTVTILSVVHGG